MDGAAESGRQLVTGFLACRFYKLYGFDVKGEVPDYYKVFLVGWGVFCQW